MLSANANDQKLSEIGLSLYRPRVARCMVLLSNRQRATQVLEGMLKVLQLPAAQIVRVIVKDFASAPLAAKLKLWDPQYILQLNMDLPPVRDFNIFCTFSPDHLSANPADKASAYQQLLLLRDKLKNDPV